MRKLLILLLLASLAFADFQLQRSDIAITLNEDGSATVEERLDLTIFGQYSMQLYQAGFNKNTLSSWQELTNISEIKTHISPKNADIRNFIIRPQPIEKSLSAPDVWYGHILIDYAAYPYYDKSGSVINNTGIVTMYRYKPRTVRYTLNENAFNMPRTETGDIMLDEDTTLSITPPSNALITYLNPVPRDMSDVKLPVRSRTLGWNGLTLVQFSLFYEMEQSLDKEVVEFFSDLQKAMRANLTSTEGIAALAILAILVLSYFYLRLSRR